MNSNVKKFVVVIVISGMLVFYSLLGGKYWLELHDLIRNKIGEEKAELRNKIWGKEGQYGGTVVTVTNKGIWIWGQWWPRFFPANDKTIYYYYDACSIDILERSKDNGVVTIPLITYSKVSDWKKQIKRGNYVLIKPNEGEWWGYSFWYFDNTGLIEQCQRF